MTGMSLVLEINKPPLVRTLLYAGGIVWIVVYIFVILIGFKDHTYGIPLVAICLDITWEALFTFKFPSQDRIQYFITWAWLILDCVILGQLYYYGKIEQSIPAIRDNFYLVVTGTLLVALVGHWTFHIFFKSKNREGALSAYITNAFISILFVFLFFARQVQPHGLSYPAAWLKMLGTMLTIIANIILWGKIARRRAFPLYVFAIIIIFDLIFILLLLH